MKFFNKKSYNRIQKYITGETIKSLGKLDNCAKKYFSTYFNNIEYYTDIPIDYVGFSNDRMECKPDPFSNEKRTFIIPYPTNIFIDVLKTNSIKTVKYLYYRLHSYPYNHIDYAAMRDRFLIVNFLFSKGYECSRLTMIDCVKNNISLQLANFMLKMPQINNLNLQTLASANGSLKLTQFYCNKFDLNPQSIVCAAENNHIDIVKYLHNIMNDNMCDIYEQKFTEAIDIAAKNNHDDVVKFFHSVGVYLSQCTYLFMLKYNYINIIKLCHTFKTDYESIYSFESVIDEATSYLRLDIIKYYETIGKIFTVKAFYVLSDFINDLNMNDLNMNYDNRIIAYLYRNNDYKFNGSYIIDIDSKIPHNTFDNEYEHSGHSGYSNHISKYPEQIIDHVDKIIKYLAIQICTNVNIQKLGKELLDSANRQDKEIGNIINNTINP